MTNIDDISLESIADYMPIHRPDIRWEIREKRVMLWLPLSDRMKNLRHVRVLAAAEEGQWLKPIVDDIWMYCDGQHSIAQVHQKVESAYPGTTRITLKYIANRVMELVERGWLVLKE